MATRRRLTVEFESGTVLELISGAKTPSQVYRQHNLNPQVVSRWKAYFLNNALSVFQSDEQLSAEHVRIAGCFAILSRVQSTTTFFVLSCESPSRISGSAHSASILMKSTLSVKDIRLSREQATMLGGYQPRFRRENVCTLRGLGTGSNF